MQRVWGICSVSWTDIDIIHDYDHQAGISSTLILRTIARTLSFAFGLKNGEVAYNIKHAEDRRKKYPICKCVLCFVYDETEFSIPTDLISRREINTYVPATLGSCLEFSHTQVAWRKGAFFSPSLNIFNLTELLSDLSVGKDTPIIDRSHKQSTNYVDWRKERLDKLSGAGWSLNTRVIKM